MKLALTELIDLPKENKLYTEYCSIKLIITKA